MTASKGVAAFSGMTLTTASSGYTLQVSSSGLSSAATSAITVTPAAATQVVITQQPPASVLVNTGFGLQAAIEDAYGNVETSAGNTVKVALDNNPTRAKLGGTLSVNASKGVARFSGLTINKVGSGYTLQLTSSGLSSAVTSPITVTSSAAIFALLPRQPRPVRPTTCCAARFRQPRLPGQPGNQETHSADLTNLVVRVEQERGQAHHYGKWAPATSTNPPGW